MMHPDGRNYPTKENDRESRDALLHFTGNHEPQWKKDELWYPAVISPSRMAFMSHHHRTSFSGQISD